MEEQKPTIKKCLEVVRELNKGLPATEEQLKDKANWLYMLNRLSFFDDIPILLEIVFYDRKQQLQKKTDVK